jgi:hypothetical protein
MESSARQPIGFVLLSFNRPEQTIYLCRKLSEAFGDPPIALHHDFGQCNLERRALPSNVHLVEPWLATGWGVFAIVEANLAALSLLYQVADPDWCVSLSTTDYPIKTAEHILADLGSSPWDAFLDHRELIYRRLPRSYQRVSAAGFNDPLWPVIGYNRYVAISFEPRRVTWYSRILNRLLRGPHIERLFTPFSAKFRPYGGDAWYTVNRRAASVLTEQNALFWQLRRHYLGRPVPEESVYQTILCNAGLRICPDNLRYADWSDGGAHPRLLSREDIPAFAKTNAHFARKFPFDLNLFSEVDAAAGESVSGMALDREAAHGLEAESRDASALFAEQAKQYSVVAPK